MTDSRLQRWTPELRRAIMKVRPDYFAWSPAEQERYGAAIPQEDHERLCQALFRELWGRKIRSPKAAARAATRIPLDEQNRWNETVLPLFGIGEDCFHLNEWFARRRNDSQFPHSSGLRRGRPPLPGGSPEEGGADLSEYTLPRVALSDLGASVCWDAVHLRNLVDGSGTFVLRVGRHRPRSNRGTDSTLLCARERPWQDRRRLPPVGSPHRRRRARRLVRGVAASNIRPYT